MRIGIVISFRGVAAAGACAGVGTGAGAAWPLLVIIEDNRVVEGELFETVVTEFVVDTIDFVVPVGSVADTESGAFNSGGGMSRE